MYLLSILARFLVWQTSIYSFTVADTQGGSIHFDDFRGKKIMLVNIASNSTMANQLGELQQLQQEYGDSLVVIGFPSNSFNNENRSNADIKAFCQSQYGIDFLLAAKGSVKGSDIQPVYNWLAHQSENGVMENEVINDFQKYLVDDQGNLIGVFAGSVSPLNQQIIDAITGSQN